MLENIRFYTGDVNPQIRNVPQSLTSARNAIRHPRLEGKKRARLDPGGVSGGPCGEVIGVVTSVIFEGFGLAISANTVKLYLDRLVDGEFTAD